MSFKTLHFGSPDPEVGSLSFRLADVAALPILLNPQGTWPHTNLAGLFQYTET